MMSHAVFKEKHWKVNSNNSFSNATKTNCSNVKIDAVIVAFKIKLQPGLTQNQKNDELILTITITILQNKCTNGYMKFILTKLIDWTKQ